MKTHLLAFFALALAASAASPVVRPAPDFAFSGASGKKSLRSLRGQPVVLLLAKSPRTRDFRKQLEALATIYQEFASRGVVFIAAFSEKDGEVPSDIPFILAPNGPALAAAYGQRDDFAIAIIGRDGNLDLNTGKVLKGSRVREVIQNSFAVQDAARREKPKGPPPL